MSRRREGPYRPELVEAVRAGEPRAIARVITLVENGRPGALQYLRELHPHTGKSLVVGITGAPGAGKSTLVDAIAAQFRADGRKVGIIAVDPTSPFTGGAIMGDRIRMQSRSVDAGTFIRSMATRGHLGGLAGATGDVVSVLDAAGFEVILVETVGVGQDEVEVARNAHITVVLLVPGMGDDIQAMKAGIMEIGEIFVINKSDHAGAAQVEASLRALLALAERPDGWVPPIVRTVASTGLGVSECVRSILACRDFLGQSTYQHERALRLRRERLVEMARDRITERILSAPGLAVRLIELAQQVEQRDLDPFTAVEDLLRSAGFEP